MGADGRLWGGEFMHARYTGFKRLAHFQSVAMLGGAQAMREPWRNTFAHLAQALGWERLERDYAGLEIVRYLGEKPTATLQTMARRGLNSPLSSSCGRLFDAVAAAVGVCRERVQHEGQAAIELEALAAPCFDAEASRAYPARYQEEEGHGVLSWAPLWKGLLADLQLGVESAVIAARFHQGLAQAVAQVARGLVKQHGLEEVVLSGGVFQNRLLLEGVSDRLYKAGLQVHAPIDLPANDGGLSLGQAAVAAALQRVKARGTT